MAGGSRLAYDCPMLPVIQLEGPPQAQGLAHGRLLAERIARNVETYFRRFHDEGGLTREQVLARVTPYWDAVAKQSPDYVAGARGIAEGSGIPELEIAALNLRYELLYHQFTAMAMPDGCTLFALLPERSASGHLLIGQNWDWIPEVQGAVLHIQQPDGLEQLCFTEAGIFGGKIGLSSAGLGLAINGLTSTADDWSRLRRPFHVRCWEILAQRELDAAARVITDEPRGCSTHYLIAQTPDRVAGLEAAPWALNWIGAENGVYSHANHFVDPAGLGIAEPPSPFRKWSVHRAARCRQVMLSDTPLTERQVLERLRDHVGHPNSICRHPDPERGGSHTYQTVTSVLMDLTAGEMWISDGPPCLGSYQHLRLERAAA